MTQIQQKFYRLTNEEWVSLNKLLTHSELLVLYYLRTLDPFGDKYQEASTKAIAETLKISQRTVQRAVIKLAELELIDLEISRFNFRVRSKHETPQEVDETENLEVKKRLKVATPMSLDDTHVASTSPMSRQRHPCRVNVTHVASTPPMSSSTPVTQSETESYDSKTIQTYSDFKKTLSEDERERFFYFVRQEVKNFREPIKDLEAWLASQNAANQNRWEVYYSLFQSSRPSKARNEGSSALENSDGSKTEKRLSLREEIEQQRQRALAYYASLKESEQQQEMLSHDESLDKTEQPVNPQQEDQPNV